MELSGPLRGDGLSSLTKILSRYLDDNDDVRDLLVDSDINPNDVPKRDTTARYSRVAIKYAWEHGKFTAFLRRVEQRFEGMPDAERDLATWRAGPRKIDDIRGIVDEISARTAELEGLSDPTDAVDVLISLRGSVSDVMANLETSDAAEGLFPTLDRQSYDRIRRRILIACRRLRAAVDHLSTGLEMQDTSRAERQSFDSSDFIRMHAITGILIDDREEVTARARELIRLLRDNSAAGVFDPPGLPNRSSLG